MNFLYFNMVCQITIGQVLFNQVNSLQIVQSIKEFSDTARLIVPRSFTAKVAGKPASLAKKNITDYIRVGDPVVIKLGYNGSLYEEFKGYVTRLGADVPLEIECMDEMVKLKNNNFIKTFQKASLSDLLSFIAPGYKHKVIDDIDLGKLTINNQSAYQVLEDLRKHYGLHSYFTDKVLHVGLPVSIKPLATHQYVIDRNVRAKSNDLKFVKKEDVKLLLKAISINRNGKRIFSEYGDKGGTQRTLHFADKTETELKRLAEKNYQSLSFDGYNGTLPCWGIPRSRAGEAVEIIDKKHSERNGKYLIEGVTIKFNGSNGFLRENKLGLKL